MKTKKTASDHIAEFMDANRQTWFALHEFEIRGVSENAKAARMREMTRAGVLEVRFREGERYKEWRYVPTHDPEEFI